MQTPGFTATSTPKDITAGLDPGAYVAQVRSARTVFFATAERAPRRTSNNLEQDVVLCRVG